MPNRKDTLFVWDRIMAAISFAEAGEAETAREIIKQETRERIEKRRELKVRRLDRIRPELRL